MKLVQTIFDQIVMSMDFTALPYNLQLYVTEDPLGDITLRARATVLGRPSIDGRTVQSQLRVAWHNDRDVRALADEMRHAIKHLIHALHQHMEGELFAGIARRIERVEFAIHHDGPLTQQAIDAAREGATSANEALIEAIEEIDR